MNPYQPHQLPLQELDYRLLLGLGGDDNGELD